MKTLILILLLSPFSAIADGGKLTLFVRPPEHALDWSSPGALYKSLLKARLMMSDHPFGTAAGVLSCGQASTAFSHEPESFDVLGPLLFSGKGLGLLYSTHRGRLLSPEATVVRAKELMKDPATRSFWYLLNDGHCKRIRSYLDQVRKHKFAQNYGLPHRPLMAEGASETSLLVSVLEVAGVLGPNERERWERVLYLPKDLSGEPLSDSYVPITSVLSGNWGKHSDDAVILRFWDAGLVVSWINSPGQKPEIDKRSSPVPQGTPWEQANSPAYMKLNSAEAGKASQNEGSSRTERSE